MYLGLDLSHKGAHYAATKDGETFERGVVTLDTFPRLLALVQPVAVGMEYSGRIAEQWCLCCLGHSVPAYIVHSVLRKSLNNIQRTTTKTDPEDAKGIAKNLRLWHDRDLRRLVGFPADMFTSAEETRAAWTLRALLSDVEALTRTRTAAKLRLLNADRLNMPERAAIWGAPARSEMPEESLHMAKAYAMAHFGREYELLLTVPGVGEKTALALIGYMLPLERFEETGPKGADFTFRNIRRYVGFMPVKKQSGDMDSEHRAAPRGQSRLRSILTMGARGAAHPSRTDRFACQYKGLVAKGLRVCYAL